MQPYAGPFQVGECPCAAGVGPRPSWNIQVYTPVTRHSVNALTPTRLPKARSRRRPIHRGVTEALPKKQHQDFLHLIADHYLTQIVDKPTRNDKTLDLIITNYHSIVDNLETIPPIGETDHNILSLEITVSLRRRKNKPRQILKYSKTNWDKIKKDIKTTYNKINQSQDSQDIDSRGSIWNTFQDSLQMSISKYIPTKTIKYDNNLPWISDEVRKKNNEYRRKLRKRQPKQKPKIEALKKLKREIQKEQKQTHEISEKFVLIYQDTQNRKSNHSTLKKQRNSKSRC